MEGKSSGEEVDDVVRQAIESSAQDMEAEDEELAEELEMMKTEGDQVLYLNYHNLQELPYKLLQEAPDFSQVTRIYLKKNLLKTLPNDIGKLPNLLELYIPGNKLEELPEGLALLCKLESLDVSHNELTHLPASVCRLAALERLQISSNVITRLPREIKKLKNLKVLEVMNNKLNSLPEEISQCKNLCRLLVDRNSLKWLPSHLTDMANLEEVSAVGNKLLCLPLELGNMNSLKCLYVDDNPYLHAVPLSVTSQELGFSSCGSENFEERDEEVQPLQFLNIRHSDTEEKRIFLPKEIIMSGKGEGEVTCIPTLVELAMRQVHTHHMHALTEKDLPRNLFNIMESPAGYCLCCKKPMFVMGYPLVFEGQVRLYSIYKLALCCSQHCVKLASIIVNLPLIYPDPQDMCMAVALVGNQ